MPIYAVLTQPYYNRPESVEGKRSIFIDPKEALNETFIMSSHVKFLQAAGARIVPLSYKLDLNGFNTVLGQVNGVYIPGDSADILFNEAYMEAVRTVLQWVQ